MFLKFNNKNSKIIKIVLRCVYTILYTSQTKFSFMRRFEGFLYYLRRVFPWIKILFLNSNVRGVYSAGKRGQGGREELTNLNKYAL